MKKPAPPDRRTAAVRLRDEIEKAEAEGMDRADMTLRCTFTDVHQLKRDPELALTDISFAAGEMRFLGVKVLQGGVAVSGLQAPAA